MPTTTMINIHDIRHIRAKARAVYGAEWLEIAFNADAIPAVTLFMPYALAQILADAINDGHLQWKRLEADTHDERPRIPGDPRPADPYEGCRHSQRELL